MSFALWIRSSSATQPVTLNRYVAILFLGVATALLMLNVVLAQQLMRYRRSPPDREVQVGTLVPALRVMDDAGHPTSITYGKDSRDTLIFVFSPRCGWCRDNWPKWHSIVREIRSERTRVFALNLLDGLTAEYLARLEPKGLSIVHDPDADSVRRYRLGLTPQTLLVGSDGRVRHVWSGSLTHEQITEVKQTLLERN